MRRSRPGGTCLAALLLLLPIAHSLAPEAAAADDVLPERFRLEQILTGTQRPAGMAIAPDGRIFYAERTTGQVRVVRGGVLQAAPFVTVPVAATGSGEGLIDIALHPDFPANGWLYLFHTQSGSRENRIVRYTDRAGTGCCPLDILMLPASADGTRVGGSLAFGADGKLYVTTGDLAASGNAQNGSSLAGKLLRMNDDGSVPADNPSPGSRVYALGFRSGGGLGVNRTVGTLYQTDQGAAGVAEECNAITEGNASQKNYAWDAGAGKLSNPAYVDPLTEHTTVVTPTAVRPYTGTRYPASFRNAVYYATKAAGKIEKVDVAGAKLDTFVSRNAFFDPARDGDGTPDAGCPKAWADAGQSGDGYLYLTVDADSSANGLYRILYDDSAGPREVSPAGSTHPLMVEKIGPSTVRITFEDQKRDAFVGPPLASGQHNSRYTVWRGSLPIDTDGDGDADWSHTAAAATNGTALNAGTLHFDLATGTGSEYLLVSSQNANLEGIPGRGSDGTPIPGYAVTDWCDNIGFGKQNGLCAQEFMGEDGQPMLLPDEHGVLHSLHEFRTGNVIHLDFAAFDCDSCRQQASTITAGVEKKYRARGVKTVMVLEKKLNGRTPYANQQECTQGIQDWRAIVGGDYTILCDRDMNGDGDGDAYAQFNRGGCGIFPINYYIDRNWVIFDFICGIDFGMDPRLSPKAWPEWCE